MNTDERRAVVGLWSFPGVGPKSLAAFEARVPRREWASLSMREVGLLFTKNEAMRADFLRWPSLLAKAEAVEAALRLRRERVCLSGDPEYPAGLVGLSSAPAVLFFRGPGAVEAGRGRVAIVGTRSTTAEWETWTRDLSAACAREGLVVVSGGAEGVDTAAHVGALEAGGVTWAFAASGLDQLDEPPRKVLGLLDERSTMFTMVPPGGRAKEGLFIQRNRFISGAAQVVLVVRGKANSGARHTAQFAVEQKRRLLAVGSLPSEEGAELNRELLRAGAGPCFDVTDVMRALSLEQKGRADDTFTQQPIDARSQRLWRRLPSGAFDMERALAALPELGSGDVTALLIELELAGWVVPRTGRRYEKRA
ncbi:MAG: DNA-processing protein DprA [Myxococcaceae bacterium]|jgi:DNA processing protein|nr:DNA-processing protein DprA [Myxococcaceae bacterium]